MQMEVRSCCGIFHLIWKFESIKKLNDIAICSCVQFLPEQEIIKNQFKITNFKIFFV